MTEKAKDEMTDFGYQRVPLAEKAKHVAGVFESVASKYDMMNDIMSLGTHRLMKRFAVEMAALRPGHRVLDLAGGTGDLTALMSPIVGNEGGVVLCDINLAMVDEGRDRMLNRGIVSNVDYVIGDAEALPFPDNSFDALTIAFGLRNVTRKDVALAAMQRVLKPGGRLVVLEFSTPPSGLMKNAFDAFTRTWPSIGKALVGDRDSYQYLRESIKMHPDQETLKTMVMEAGFSKCRFHNLAGGTAAIHFGIKA